ncbi:MAG: tetratricopeptide repeat protein, partial [Desulfarculus sp.]|nr:tetratricopeptide repeat protein [Desulfarculus sp.]
TRAPAAVDSPQLAARLAVMAAVEKLSTGQLKPAEADLSKALGHNPSEDSAMFLLELVRAGLGGHLQAKALTSFGQAFLAMLDGRVDAALVGFRQARQADDKLWQATLFEANVLAGSGQAPKAAALLTELVKQHPKAARAYLSLGMITMDQGQLAEGVAYLRQALALEPGLAEAHYRLGSVALAQGELEPAEQEFRAAVAADPYKEEAINDLGLVYASTGRVQEAEKAYLKSLELNPAYPSAHINLGTLYAQTGRMNQAIDEFNKALALDDALGEAHVNLATAYTIRGEWETAIKHADLAAQLGAQVPQVLLDKLAPHRK